MISPTGLIVPSTFETAVTATSCVRSVSSSSSASRSSCAVVGDRHDTARTAPVRSASCCQGTMLEWCSISVSRISSPGLQVRIAPTAGHEVDALGRAVREDHLFARCGVDEALAPCSRASSYRSVL